MNFKKLYAALAALPVLLFGFSVGPPPRRTGAAVDGGLNCTACHGFNPALTNSDARGSLAVSFDSPSYRPGVPQTVHVRLAHPEQARWGFQLTARLGSDPSKSAGTLSSTTDIRVVCDNGREEACDGALEFATHRLAPRTAAGAGFTFDVQWTPPATDVGDIVFYAAGNAADGNGIPSAADRVYTAVRTLSAPCGLTTKPTISAITDSASYRAAWAPNGLLTIFGTGFAAAGQTRALQGFDVAAASQTVPRELGCVAVEIGGGRVPVAYVSASQLNVQAPTTAQNSGAIPVTIVLNPGRPNELKSDVANNLGLQRFSPSLFTSASKSVVAQVAGTTTVVSDARPARPGELITLYGTGLGYTDPVWQAGEIPTRPSALLNPATVSIGGAGAEVIYAGLAVGSVSGLYQLNVRIPAAAPDGNLPVVVTVGAASTQADITMPVRR